MSQIGVVPKVCFGLGGRRRLEGEREGGSDGWHVNDKKLRGVLCTSEEPASCDAETHDSHHRALGKLSVFLRERWRDHGGCYIRAVFRVGCFH